MTTSRRPAGRSNAAASSGPNVNTSITVEVWSPEVKDLKYVRFAWEMYARHNLYNISGIPAITFRTDRQKTKTR